MALTETHVELVPSRRRDVIDLTDVQVGVLETPGDGLLGERARVPVAVEALLLRGRDHPAVIEDHRGRVEDVAVVPEGDHTASAASAPGAPVTPPPGWLPLLPR